MYYIEDSRFETKGPYFRNRDEAQETLEADVASLRQAGAAVTGFEYPGSEGRSTGYTVRLNNDYFELAIQHIN
jgi:hypothetical protein